MLHSLFYLETAQHVSGDTSTHHQERIQLLSTASGICHTVIATCRYRGGVGTGLSVLSHTQTSSNSCMYELFVLCRFLYCLCVYVYHTTATGWLPNCS